MSNSVKSESNMEQGMLNDEVFFASILDILCSAVGHFLFLIFKRSINKITNLFNFTGKVTNPLVILTASPKIG